MRKKWAVPLATLSFLSVLGLNMGTAAFADEGTAVTTQASASAVALSEDQVVSRVKEVLTIPPGYVQQNVSLQSNWMGQDRSVYSINWSAPPGPVSVPTGGMNVTVDANTGQILQFNLYNGKGNNWTTAQPISTAKAKEIAQTWLQKLAPAQQGQLVLQPVDASVQPYGGFSFWYVRKVNGILATFDSVRITLDSSGQLTDYQFQWQDATFADASSVLSEKDVESTYTQALGLHLQYQTLYGWGTGQPKTVLTYAPRSNPAFYYGPFVQSSGPWIDAKTGNVVNTDGKALTTPSTPTFPPLDPNGSTTLPTKLAHPLSSEQAEQQIRNALGLSSDYAVTDKSRNLVRPDSGSYWLQFTFRNANNNDNINVSMDENTGLIANYNHYVNNPQPAPVSSTPSINIDQAQQTAVAFVKKVLPNLTGAISLQPNTISPPPGYGSFDVHFNLLVHGIPANDINVSVDPTSGTVQNYYLSMDLLGNNYPNADHVISLQAAQTAYLQKQPLQLQYVLPIASTTPNPKTGNFQYQNQAILVYAPLTNTPGYLDATTGKWDDFPSPVTSGSTPTDIKGHYGEKEMLLLAERGLLKVDNGKVHPDNKMTRAQFVSLLVRASGMYYGGNGVVKGFQDVPSSNPYYADIMQAVQQGWLPLTSKFYPDKPMTRADAADLLVSFLGWHSLATHTRLFSLPFSDGKSVPVAERGDAAIAAEFGWIPSVKGKFLPNQAMTVADSAVAVVHALQSQSSVHP